MRIAIFTDSFLPHLSGVCTAVLNQANELSRLGHEVVIYRPMALGKNSKRNVQRTAELNADVKDVPLSIRTPGQQDLRIAVPTLLSSYVSQKRFKADIIHVHTEWGCGWEGVMTARMMGLPIVGTFHTFFAEPEYLKQFHLPNFKRTQEMMWRYSVFFYNHCDSLIAPSISVAEQLIDKGIQVEPVNISNGIPMPDLVPSKQIDETKKQLGIQGTCFLYVGRLSEEKSLPIVLRAFASIRERIKPSTLVIIGDGKIREELQQLVIQLGIEDHVVFTGRIEHVDLIQQNIPRVADAFVTASKTENQPVSILEAMAFGVPVIGVDAKGVPEMVRHEKNGLLSSPDDVEDFARSMLRIASNRDLQTNCAQGALHFAAQNSIGSVVQQLEDFYKDTLHTRTNTPRPRRRLLRRTSNQKI